MIFFDGTQLMSTVPGMFPVISTVLLSAACPGDRVSGTIQVRDSRSGAARCFYLLIQQSDLQ